MNNKQIESEIQAKGLTASRVTPADIEANIASEHYFSAWDGVNGAMSAGNLTQSHHEYDTLTQPAPASTPYEAMRLLTFCIFVLRNGFTVTGESACASPENFDAELGRKIARQNAINKMWPLLGYELKQRLYEQQNPPA